MLWSEVAIDYSKGFTHNPDGRLIPNKIGCWVYTIEELDEIIARRKQK